MNTIHYYVEENYMTIFSSFSANFSHIIIPSWQLTVSMHQVGSLICNMSNWWSKWQFCLILFLFFYCYSTMLQVLQTFQVSLHLKDYITGIGTLIFSSNYSYAKYFSYTLKKQNRNFSKHLVTTIAWLSLLEKFYKCNAGNWEQLQL